MKTLHEVLNDPLMLITAAFIAVCFGYAYGYLWPVFILPAARAESRPLQPKEVV